jgi:hypothetical protein
MLGAVVGLAAFFMRRLQVIAPHATIDGYDATAPMVTKVSGKHFLGENFLLKNKQGLWNFMFRAIRCRLGCKVAA